MDFIQGFIDANRQYVCKQLWFKTGLILEKKVWFMTRCETSKFYEG